MPRSANAALDLKNIKGYLTEYPETMFPENAAIEVDNVSFSKTPTSKGVVYTSTRPSLRLETPFATLASAATANANVNVYEWKNPGNLNVEDSIIVVQQEDELTFWLMTETSPAFSGTPLHTLSLTTYMPDPTKPISRADFSEGRGKLFVAMDYMDPLVIDYDGTAFTETRLILKIRDLKGVDDGLAYNERPATLSDLHKYNLYNQAWTQARIDAVFTSGNVYPSNADIWWMYKDAYDKFTAARLFDEAFTNINQPAPKGWYIVEAFNIDRSAVSGIAGLPVETSDGHRPSCICFSGGRVFYSGINTGNYYGKVYFSQIWENDTDLENCYQRNDPTSEELSDLVDTDGGVIDLGATGAIYRLLPYKRGVLVFAERGVWYIGGGSLNSSFNPTDFSIDRLSGVPSIDNNSFVIANGTPFWWSVDGIYSVTTNEYGDVIVASATEKMIKTYYNSIPTDKKRKVFGAFDSALGQLVWIFEDAVDTTHRTYRCVVFDVNVQAFSKWSFKVPIDYVVPTSIGVEGVSPAEYIGLPMLRLLIQTNGGLTFAKFEGIADTTDFLGDPVLENSYSCFFTIGHRMHGGFIRRFSSDYIYVLIKNEDNASCILTYGWDFRGDNGIEEEVYRWLEPGDTLWRRFKLLGRGQILTMTFKNTPGKVFKILGWATRELVHADVNH